MRPRGWFESFLLIFALGGIAFGLGWKLLTGEEAETSTVIGLAFGVFAGLVGAPKFVESSTTRTYTDRAAFLKQLDTRLAELDILPATQLDNYRVYKSEAAGSFSLGPVSAAGIVKRVRVRLEDPNAVLVGPSSVLEQLTGIGTHPMPAAG